MPLDMAPVTPSARTRLIITFLLPWLLKPLSTVTQTPTTLVGYVATCDNSLMEASLAIAGALHQVQYEETCFAGASYDDPDSSDSDYIPSSVPSDSENNSKRSRSSADCGISKSSSSASSSDNSRVLSISAPNMSAEESCVFSESLQKSDVINNDTRTSVYHFNFGR